MKQIAQNFVVTLWMAALFVCLAWVLGFNPDGIFDGHWPGSNDHPTNWYDMALHPDVR